jgi:hypothetical protein
MLNKTQIHHYYFILYLKELNYKQLLEKQVGNIIDNI